MRFIGPYGWVIETEVENDPSKYKHLRVAGGLALPGDRRRCQSGKRKAFPPAQCQLYAEGGTPWCRFHTSGDSKVQREKLELWMNKGYFRNIAGDQIRDILDESRKRSPEERLSILEEVELMRATAGEALGMFERSLDPRASNKVKALAIECLRESLLDVSTIVQRAAQTRALNESTADSENIEYIVAHIERILLQSLTFEEAEKVINKIRDIRVPSKISNEAALKMAEDIQSIREEMSDVDGVKEDSE